ncbi:transposase [Streptomyces diastaticus]|uniref:transposase n=1 Tax=Streptomyces TaxID=1883 RepID=UPI001F2CCB1F|nr:MULTISPECIES: transposase [Streptomyces]
MLQSLRSAKGLALVRSVAEWNEHTHSRTNCRNEHRDKTLTTQVDDLELAARSLGPAASSLVCWNGDAASTRPLCTVIMEAYIEGVSTRSVNDLVKALGVDTGTSKCEVSRICAALDEPLTAFRTRLLDRARFPYIYLDVTYCKAWGHHQIASRAVAIATGITEDGGREVLGVVLKDAGEMVAATIRTIFAQPSQSVVRAQVDTVTDMLGSQFPRANRCCWKPRTT